MARITVEDCVEVVPNRFKLVMYAARRAREIAAGAPLTIVRDNDKNPVIALREIAEQTVSLDALEESLIKSMQKHVFRDEAEPEMDEEMDAIGWQTEVASPPDSTTLALIMEDEEEEDAEAEDEDLGSEEGEATDDESEPA